MRELAKGPRKSGRTTRFIEELPEDAGYIYVVTASFQLGQQLRNMIKNKKPDLFSKIAFVSVDSLYRLRGVDPLKIYFEHTAYEYATSRELADIYDIEDSKDRIIWGVK